MTNYKQWVKKKTDHVLNTNATYKYLLYYLIYLVNTKWWLMFETIVELTLDEMFSIVMWVLLEWWSMHIDIDDEDVVEWEIGERTEMTMWLLIVLLSTKLYFTVDEIVVHHTDEFGLLILYLVESAMQESSLLLHLIGEYSLWATWV